MKRLTKQKEKKDVCNNSLRVKHRNPVVVRPKTIKYKWSIFCYLRSNLRPPTSPQIFSLALKSLAFVMPVTYFSANISFA